MSTLPAVSSQLVTFNEYFKSRLPNIAAIIPKTLTPERIGKIAVSALARNPTLLQCTPASVWRCVANAAFLGLEIDMLGAAYLVPFINSKTRQTDCQLIVGYQGLIDLCRRSGHISSIEATLVWDDDVFEIYKGTDPRIVHVPQFKTRNEIKVVYAVATLTDGSRQFDYMTRDEVEYIRSCSKGKDSLMWVSHFGEGCRKTIVRRLCKYLPKSIELKAALAVEDAGESETLPLTGMDIDVEVIASTENEPETASAPASFKKKTSAPAPDRAADPTPAPADNEQAAQAGRATLGL